MSWLLAFAGTEHGVNIHLLCFVFVRVDNFFSSPLKGGEKMTKKEKILERLAFIERKLEALPANAAYVQGWEKEALKYDLEQIGWHVRFVRDYFKYSPKDE